MMNCTIFLVTVQDTVFIVTLTLQLRVNYSHSMLSLVWLNELLMHAHSFLGAIRWYKKVRIRRRRGKLKRKNESMPQLSAEELMISLV